MTKKKKKKKREKKEEEVSKLVFFAPSQPLRLISGRGLKIKNKKRHAVVKRITKEEYKQKMIKEKEEKEDRRYYSFDFW